MSDQKTLTEWPPVGIEIPEPESYTVQDLGYEQISELLPPGNSDVLPDIKPMLLPTPVDDNQGGYLVPPEAAEAIQAWIARGAPPIRFSWAQCTPGRINLTMGNAMETIRVLVARAFGIPAEYLE